MQLLQFANCKYLYVIQHKKDTCQILVKLLITTTLGISQTKTYFE